MKQNEGPADHQADRHGDEVLTENGFPPQQTGIGHSHRGAQPRLQVLD